MTSTTQKNPMRTPGKKAWHKGRASVSQDAGESAVLQARVGSTRLSKFRSLGGAKWLRALIDQSDLPSINSKTKAKTKTKTKGDFADLHRSEPVKTIGFIFRHSDPYSRAALIDHLKDPVPASIDYTMGEHRIVGNHVWFLDTSKQGKKTIGLFVLHPGTRGKKKTGWGYKRSEESKNPDQIDCPLSLLAKASPANGAAAIEWRSRVKNFHTHMKRRAKICKPGAKVLVGYGTYILVEKIGRKGWTIKNHVGEEFVIDGKTLSKCPFF